MSTTKKTVAKATKKAAPKKAAKKSATKKVAKKKTFVGKMFDEIKASVKASAKKEPAKKVEATGSLKSVIVPSVNKDWSKLLFLDAELLNKVKAADKKHKKEGTPSFCHLMDSDLNHSLLSTGFLSLDKKQFDTLLKEKYNLKMQNGRGGKPLKNVE